MSKREHAPFQARTAALWARRAISSYRRAVRMGSRQALLDGEDMRHEALEHGALVGDYGRTAARLQRTIEKSRAKAKRAIP